MGEKNKNMNLEKQEWHEFGYFFHLHSYRTLNACPYYYLISQHKKSL